MRKTISYLICPLIFGCSSIENQNAKVDIDTLENKEYHDKNSQKSFHYDPSVSTINGILCKKAVYGTNSGENDKKPNDTIVVVALENAISVVNPAGTDTNNLEENYPNEYNIDTIQLSFPSYYKIDKSIGHAIQLKGTFFHSDNGNHFTNVLLLVKEIKDGADSSILTYK